MSLVAVILATAVMVVVVVLGIVEIALIAAADLIVASVSNAEIAAIVASMVRIVNPLRIEDPLVMANEHIQHHRSVSHAAFLTEISRVADRTSFVPAVLAVKNSMNMVDRRGLTVRTADLANDQIVVKKAWTRTALKSVTRIR